MKNPIFDIDNWREIGQTLARNKTRTLLTAFGIFWGTAMLALLWGGASGMEGMLRRNFAGFNTNMGFVMPGRTTMPYRGYKKGMDWKLTRQEVEAIRRSTPILEYSSTIQDGYCTIAYSTKTKSARIQGVEGSYDHINLPLVVEGRFINEGDVKEVRKVAAIGSGIAAELFGSESPVGKYVAANGVYFMVVGVVKQLGEASFGGRLEDVLVVPGTTLERAFNRSNDVGALMFTAKAGHKVSEIKPYIDRVVKAHHPIHPDDENAYFFADIAQNFEMVDNMFIGFSLLALFVGAGTLIAGLIGVANIMWIIVKERTQEIGIRRAIGAKPRDIIVEILSEGTVLTTIAGLLGLSFATLVLFIADKVTADPVLGSAGFSLQFNHAIVIMAVFLVLGSLAGLFPAIKAMRIKPIEALNDK